MTLYLLKIGKWLLSKVAVLLIATAVAVGAFALYLYVGDSIRVDRERIEKLQEAQELARGTYEKLENAHTEILLITNELNEAREKLKLANELVERLEGFLSKLEYFFLSESEKRKVDNELAQAKNESSQLGPLIESLRVKHANLRVDRTNLSDEALSLEEKIAYLESSSSEMVR
jgi:chromosome segregation ATPase